MRDKIIWPERRKFIQKIPATIAALTLAPSLLLPNRSLSRSLHGTAAFPAIPAPPSVPALASAVGFNSLTFWDGFDSVKTIDVNNTLQSGYNWYLTNTIIPQDNPDGSQALGTTQAPSSISVSNSIMSFTPSQPSGGWLTNTGYTGNSGTRYVGTPISATGGYFECLMQFDPFFITPPLNFSFPNNFWPAFWMQDAIQGLHINDQNTAPTRAPELDFFEYFGYNPLTDHYSVAMTTHEWTDNINAAGASQPLNLRPTSWADYHTYGCLWLTQAQNGGTGLIKRYFDGTHIASADLTYSSSITSPECNTSCYPGVFASFDTSAGFSLQVGSGHNWTMNVDYIGVWQP